MTTCLPSISWGTIQPLERGAAPVPLPMAAHLDNSSGYGTYTTQLTLELAKLGYAPSIYCPSTSTDIPASMRRYHVKQAHETPTLFVIYPCVIQPAEFKFDPKQRIAYMTMWESTRLTSKVREFPSDVIATLNSCRVVIVPNAWNASCFSANGIDAPIRIAPLAVDTEFFKPVPNRADSQKTLVFGTAGRTLLGGVRKGFQCVVDAFRKAFPREQQVLLRMKCFREDPDIETHNDPRIHVTRHFFSPEQLRDWYASNHVFVSGSSSEGWGRHQHESMCMGRPVIGVNFGGVSEFFSSGNGYAVDWTLMPGEGIYATMGHYAKPSVDSMAQQMQRCFEDRAEIVRKSESCVRVAHYFTTANSARAVASILQEFGIVPKPRL